MDGQIAGSTKKRVSDPGLLDDGMAAKMAKLDVSSKEKQDVEICSEVRSRLNRSPSSETLPDKVRTISATDSSLQKATHSFDFRFVDSDDEVRQLLVARTCDEHQDVTVISHPDDLSQANLVSRLSISEEGRHTLSPGKLFESSQPLTLVIDIRKLTSEELPKLNDLLDPDNPCLFDNVSQKKRPLGEHVALLVLADPEQLALVGRREDAPGADFWRRINRPGNTWQFEAQTDYDSSIEIDELPSLLAELPSAESTTDDDNTVLIDCHLHSHWRPLLLGGPGVDKQGRIRHIPGRLESLKTGQRVILKGADWKDLAFEQSIRQMLAQQCFESNGKICPLPDDVQFYQMPVGDNELHSLFQSLSHSSVKEGDDSECTSEKPIIINQSNIRDWLSPIAIAPEGYAVPNIRLLEQIQAGGAVTVTSALTEADWFRLLGSLQTILETTGLKPRLQVADSKRQPEALGLAENDKHSSSSSCQLQQKIKDQRAFSTLTYQHHAQTSHWINSQQEVPLVIQVNEQTSFSQLFDNIHITSEQKAYFGQRQSQLQKALTSGKPVVFLGMETSPTLAQLLEPLIIGQPLLVNGQLQAYPQAHVTLLWPESAKSPSSVVNLMVAMGKPCPEVDLWHINARKHQIPQTELPEQAIAKLYEAFESVPAHLCNPLPEITEELLNNLILAARRAQQVDHSKQLLSCHWRKAINSVITHGTRQHPSVRDFMKVACWHLLPDKTPDQDQAASVDPDRLNAIINSALPLNRVFVEQNLWPLARAFDPAVFKGIQLQLSYKSPFPEQGEKDVMDRLCAMILAHAPEKQRDAIAYQLAVDPAATKPWQSLAIKPTRQIKRLQDALASGWQLLLPSGQTRSNTIHALATDCFHISKTANAEAEGIERIKHRLSELLKWQGSADEPLSALARDLYYGEMSQEDRESRRLSRLHDRLTDSPVIFLQGETGTGKSYFSAKLAKASGQASVISLGPSDSEQTLMKRWQWQQHGDGDRSMAEQNRALMEWANTKSDKDGEYITLVLDEANLAEAGLLASLNGLWEPEPCIYVNGHPAKVSEKHRVILTGNPDHYSGRQMDPTLKEKLPKAYYPRLDQAFLRDRVVEPALLNHLQRHKINDIAHRASKSVMALWQYYQELLPDHEFTPRDLTDICSWVGWYLDRALSEGDSASCEQVNSLIQQSFRDLLGPEISETQQDALSALEIWFAARYQPDHTLRDRVHNHTLPDIQRDFEAFTKEFRPEFDTSGSAVIDLVQHLGQDLSRCQQAYHHDRKHGGRQATLIEGPAGRGKDATLNLLIKSVKQQAEERGKTMPEVFPLNACDCSWEQLCEVIQKAKVKGGIVVISEMNLIDSQHLEGELNDILAGDAHPGFHLFATINPPEYSGRKPLSPALKGRFRHLPIRQYNQTELQTIAEKVLPLTPEGKTAAKKLTEQHCRLRACLQRDNLPLQPTSLDLQNVARAVDKGGDFTEKALLQCLDKHYRLYLMAAELSLETLPEPPALAMGKSKFDSGLCEWFIQSVPNIDRPWLIRKSNLDSIDEKNHEIRIKARPNEEEVKAEIIRRVAQAKWQASGLSLKPYQSGDILTRALYRHWQQRWFNDEFGRTGVKADDVFSMTKEEEQTLKTPACQPYLREADKLIETWNARDIQFWPAFWHQMSDLPNQMLNDSINEETQVKALAEETDFCGLAANDGNKTTVNRALGRETDFERLKKPTVEEHKIFNTENPPPSMYRYEVINIRVTAKGDIECIDINDQHIKGVEILTPAPLPGHDQTVTLTSDQTLASYKTPPQRGQYVLPSLTPDDYIVALRMEPNLPYKLIRDRYTGLHTVFIPGAGANQSIQFDYVVESRKPGKKTLANEAQSEGSDPSARFDAHCSEGMKTVLNELFKTIADHPPEIQQILRAIKNAETTTQRVKAISDYCRQFSGKAKPKRKKNLFHFLVTQRQGSCRHRVPVFIAFCRYFGIPCRQTNSLNHGFGEYSVDGGRTWESESFGGQPVEEKEIKPEFQPVRKANAPSTPARKGNPSGTGTRKENASGTPTRMANASGTSTRMANASGTPTRMANDSGTSTRMANASGTSTRMANASGTSTRMANASGTSTRMANASGTSTRMANASGTPTRMKSAVSAALANFIGLLKDAVIAKHQSAYAESLEELDNADEADCELPETNPGTAEMVLKLWKQKDLTSFSMGVSMLLEQEALGDAEKKLIEEFYFLARIESPMTATVREILLNNDGDQVTEQLKLLYSKMIVQGGADPYEWFKSIVEILKRSILTDPAVIHFAHEALKSGWLDPVPTNGGHTEQASYYYDLLRELAKFDELKVEATHCLKKWYRKLWSREKNSQVWRLAYEHFREREGYGFFITHCHDGFSRYLEDSIISSSIQNAWTDQPEGIPNIERMLAHRPAFPQSVSGKKNHRPVIIIGGSFWCDTVIKEKVKALFQQKVKNNPDLKAKLERINQYKETAAALEDYTNSERNRIEELETSMDQQQNQAQKEEYRRRMLAIKRTHESIRRSYQASLKSLELSDEEKNLPDILKDKCRQAIQQAFSHYLYELTHSKGGCLTYCWDDAAIMPKNDYHCGSHAPSSPEELCAMMSRVQGSSANSSIEDSYLRQVLNANNALVLRSDKMTIIADEFLKSVNLSSIYDSLSLS
ncbi:AAA family ATPase [Endozoicomonas sp. ALB060]|uniref:AAA family ATPase n=1 Tax=Endozoicomonas sp. ALB060 TaxID=3403072 RepID=UPI003BB7A08F